MKKEKVLRAVKRYFQENLAQNKKYTPGDKMNYGGRIFDEKELLSLIDASLDFWLTSGPYTEKFEKELAKFLGIRYVSFVNSGSSANLLAFAALTSPKLGGKRIMPGDEVITVAAAFPTTVTPIIQYGCVPVFIDVDIPSYNINVKEMKKALSKKTKAVMLAHTLGNPFNIKEVKKFCGKNGLWLIEDNCDALGSRYRMNGKWAYTGTFGDIGTSSFYPPHHITTGEGGAVYTNDPMLKRVIDSLRDWGRDCWCGSGKDDTCGKRFSKRYGELPSGYDHKYVYSHFGYNLKATDLQAAIGCAQLAKLEGFIKKRRSNWEVLRRGLRGLEDLFILPEAEKGSSPSWFGFLLTVKDPKRLSRDEVVAHLESKGIQTRMLFAGNMIKHPCFDEMRKKSAGFRAQGELKNTDKIMNDAFWIGVYPGLDDNKIGFMVKELKNCARGR